MANLSRGRLFGFALTIVFLALAFYRVDFGALAAQLSSANYVYLAPAALTWLVGYLLRTARWRVILAVDRPIALPALFSVLMIGFTANNLLPARLGELVRAYLLGQKLGVRKTFALSTILLERVFDGLVLVALLGALARAVELPQWGSDLELLSNVVFLAAGLGVALLVFGQRLAERALALALQPLPSRIGRWTQEAFAAFVLGLRSVRRPHLLALTSLLSVAVWSVECFSYFLVSHAFALPLDGGTRLAAMGLLLVIVNLGIMLPSAPGYVGTFQFFAVAALGVFGVPKEPALALALVAHGTQYALVTAIGLLLLAREQLSLGSLGRTSLDESAVPERAEVAS
jgi:uncharacterized protein (TIRG00374 family)